jgi:uncharacterized protein GlcG (DUF336 family)
LILFGKIRRVRPISVELAIGKTCSAALYPESRRTFEGTINTRRRVAIAVEQIQMRGGVPIRIGGTAVAAVGVSSFDKSKNVEIS